ncbi:SDR family oxidoreductase [Marinobacteraceae bacterium S3BR75-40.1]
MPLHDQTFLFFGASGGIGRALVPRLLQEGVRLILAGRNPAKLEQLRQELSEGTDRVSIVQCDLGADDCAQQLERLATENPEVDGIVHCAGQNDFASIEALAPEAIDRMLTVNLRSALLLAHTFVPRFRQRQKGQFVFVGSTFGSIGFPGYTAYCASKFGLRGFAEALRRELADTPLQVLYMAPRATLTAMNPEAVNNLNKALGNHMDPPEQVADDIVRAMREQRSQTFIGWPEKLFVRINGILPRIVDRALGKQLPTIKRFLEVKS